MALTDLRTLLAQALASVDAMLAALVPAAFYTAVTDRLPRPKPALPVLGPAGFAFTDPTFGTAMLRVTDQTTAGGQACHVPSNALVSAWNCDSTRFLVMTAGGGVETFTFDGTTATHSPIHVGGYIEPAFSYVNPAILYTAGGPNSRTIQQWDVTTGAAHTVLDLDVAYPQTDPNSYVGGVLTTDADVWVTFFGGGSQDQHHYLHHSTAGLFDTLPHGFKIHGLMVERSGRYVLIGVTSGDIATGVAPIQIWDTQTGTLTPITKLPGGHGCLSYGVWVNQDCCTASTYDAMQWQIRQLATPDVTKDLISPVLLPKEVFLSEHSNWRAARRDVAVPFVSSTFRYGTTPLNVWRAWDDEIIAVATDGSGVVNRFCHHRSNPATDFWSQPIVNVDPTGRFALVTSNWENTVGAGRQDVFLVHLR